MVDMCSLHLSVQEKGLKNSRANKTMEANRIEFFKTHKRNLASIGFTKRDAQFHPEQSLRALEGFLACTLQCLYLLFDANSTKDYMDSIFTTAAGIIIYVGYLNTVLITDKIFILIDDIEEAVNARKLTEYIS